MPTASSPLADWLDYLEALHPQGVAGIELGLVRVAGVKARLNQQAGETCPVILVGGTNGKGSICAMLECILLRAGYRVGLYTSPHLLRYNERVRVNGAAVGDELLTAAFSKVQAARGGAALTYFEFGTLAAWEVFAAASVEAVILEVGLGGRLDATNVYDPACAIVSTVDIDHTAFLGPDREAIGFEKAGIFRPGIPAICGDAEPPASLMAHAARLGAPLQIMGRDFGYLKQDNQWLYWGANGQQASVPIDEKKPQEIQQHASQPMGQQIRRSGLAYPALRGENQLRNAACALAALDALHAVLPVAMKDIRQGLLAVELTGRFQVLPGQPVVVLDVAHNPQAARVLANNLLQMAFHPKTFAVFGMMQDKDIDAVIDALQARVTHWLPATLAGSRAASADFLAARLRAKGLTVVDSFASVADALLAAQEQAGEGDRILAFGSFLVVAAALQALGRKA
ncbi:MAG: dihydrofolate synthase / folylpolyglutamate synthase [Rugosibacter sp.]|jgi:dihydrofolate synthase/folylpolyglutamate synthase|nr:dihydrofolate synthase / folylpolyglutamate synthase [Rugosibacter sp.]